MTAQSTLVAAGPLEHFNGSLVRKFRIAQHLSTYDIAEATGLTHGHVSMIETGQRVPSMKVLVLVAAALNVHPGELFGGTP